MHLTYLITHKYSDYLMKATCVSLCWWCAEVSWPWMSLLHMTGAHLKGHQKTPPPSKQHGGSRKSRKMKREENKMKKSQSSPSHLQHLHDSDEEQGNDDYHSISIQVKVAMNLYGGCPCASGKNLDIRIIFRVHCLHPEWTEHSIMHHYSYSF